MNENYRNENIVNISIKAAELLRGGKIERDDISGHAGLTEAIVNLAEAFEEKYVNVDWNAPDAPDYWEEIDRFAEERLVERYGIEPKENTVTLWARVGMTLEVTQETYERLKTGDRAALQAVFDGTAGHARLDGETYFPHIEQNAGLEEMEFVLPVSRAKQAEKGGLAQDTNDPVIVYAVSGSVKQQIYSGTFDECKSFCDDNFWTFMDENEFEWALELEDTRELPKGYFDAVSKYSDEVGRDIDNDFTREHAAELVYCFENDKNLLDFDFWTQYESILGDKITFDEYSHIDLFYGDDPMDIQPENQIIIASLKNALTELRTPPQQEAEPAKTAQSLDDKILSARERQGQSPSEKATKKERER